MSESVVPSLISAASGLLGVFVGTAVPWLKEIFSERKHAHYLAIRVVLVLDKFVEGCVDVAYDDGLDDKDRDLRYRVKEPNYPSFPEDIDWRSVKHDLMYRALSIPRDLEIAKGYISASDDINNWEGIEERQYQYISLGLAAAKLARDLRKTYGIPDQDQRNLVNELQEMKKDFDKKRKARESLHEEIMT